MLQFDYLLVSAGDYHYYESTHHLIHKEAGFSRISLHPLQLPPVRLNVEDKIYVLKRKGCDSHVT